MKIKFWLRKYHKWLALIVGIQALIWSFSGLYMTAVHIDIIHGDHLVKTPQSKILNPAIIESFRSRALPAIDNNTGIELKVESGKPVFVVQRDEETFRINATTGESIPALDAAEIETIANIHYAGEAKIVAVSLLPKYPDELGGRAQAVWQVVYDDWLNATLYFDPADGHLIRKRSDLWRIFDFFWMLHIMDYDARENVNNNLLRVASSIGLLLALTGLGMLLLNFRQAKGSGPIYLIKKVHRWVGLLIGIQLVIWMLSGLMFSLLPAKKVSGNYLVSEPTSQSGDAKSDGKKLIKDFASIMNSHSRIESIHTAELLGDAVYMVKTDEKRFLVAANTLEVKAIAESVARQVAVTSYKGKGQLVQLVKEVEMTLENRRFPLPLWRADFNDSENASVYISAETGEVFAAKTDTWRLFDIFWMLHIMDYSARSDFNHSLVIFAALMTCFIAFTGIWLLLTALAKSDFRFLNRRRQVWLKLTNADGTISKVKGEKNQSLYQALLSHGIELPSNCGGGGSCGLCMVKTESSAPVSAAEQSMIKNKQLEQGFRLACQQSLSSELRVELLR